MLEAVLVSDIDGFCVATTTTCPKTNPATVIPCHYARPEGHFSLNKRDGTVCFRSDVCLTSRNNSNQDQAEIIQTWKNLQRGSVWKFINGTLVNRFGFCLQRVEPEYKYTTITYLVQAKCDPENLWQKFHFQ